MKRYNLFDWRFVASMLLLIVWALISSAYYCGEGGNKSSAQEYQSARIFSVHKLQEDFKILKMTLMEAHGNLYAQINPEDFEKAAQEVRSGLDSPKTEMEFYRALSPFVAAIGCGHTHILPSRDHEAFSDMETYFLPYLFVVIDNRLFIQDEIFPAKNAIRGSEILSINGRCSQSVIETILPNLSGDGAIQTQKLRKIGRNLSLYYDRYVEHTEKFSLHVQTPDGRTQIIKPDGLSREQFREKISTINHEKVSTLAELNIRPTEEVALLRMKTFYTVDLKKEEIQYKKYFRNLFRLIQENKIKNLVIDIRGNAGGSINLGAELLSYLMDKKFPVLKRYQMSQKVRLTYKQYVNRDLFISFKWLVTQKKNFSRNFSWHRLLKLQEPKRWFQFTGKVYVLIDGDTFSATSIFAALLRRRKNVIFVGEETGGTVCGSGVSPIHLILPNSKLRVQIPYGYVQLATSEDKDCSRGVIPDYIIMRTPKDILTGMDPVLDFVFKMIVSGQTGQFHR
jgi:hypothetical protein